MSILRRTPDVMLLGCLIGNCCMERWLAVLTAVALVAASGPLLLPRLAALDIAASASSEAQINAFVAYDVAADITKVDGVSLIVTCTPGTAEACPSTADITVIPKDINGTALATGFLAGAAVPGTAFFDFNPDLSIVPIESTTLTVSEPISPPECAGMGFDQVIILTSGNNTIVVPGSTRDLILGLGGDDKIDGGNAPDCVVGGEGRDALKGSNGADVIVGGPGNDNIEGGNGDDRLFGNEGNDNTQGGYGNDIIDGGPQTDVCQGGAGTNTIINCP